MNAPIGHKLLCSVCGDIASGYHYGAITCNGCKGFFYRSILSRREYRRCNNKIGCFVIKSNRNACQFCRYQRCVGAGMSYRTMRKFKFLEKTRSNVVLYSAMPSRDERKTTGNQLLLTSTVCDAYGKAVKSLETFAMLCTQENSVIEDESDMKLLYFRYLPGIIRFVTTFATEIPAFNSLSRQCQVQLIRSCLIEIAAFTDIIQLKHNLSRMYRAEFKIFIPKERLHLLGSFGSSLERIHQVKTKMEKLHLTTIEKALMSAIVLFCPYREGITPNALVEKIEKDLFLALKILFDSRQEKESSIFPKAIEILTELRAISALYLTNILNIKLNTLTFTK